jgi:hypothetical protein
MKFLITAAIIIALTAWHDSASAALPGKKPGEQLISEGGNDEKNGEREIPAEESDFSFKIGGMYKNLFMYQRTDSYIGYNPMRALLPRKRDLVSDMNRIRVTPEMKYSDILLIHADVDNEVIPGNYNKSYEFDSFWRDSTYNDLFKLSWEPAYSRKLYYRTKIHKAYAKLSVSDLSLTLGRQQIRFGSGKLWNPLDILNPITPTFIEGPEEQKGTDAAKVDYYFSDSAVLTVVYDQKRRDNDIKKLNPKYANYIGRFKMTFSETDIAVLGGMISQKYAGGADIATNFMDGMLRGSLIYFWPEKGPQFFQASTGFEYSFRMGLNFLVEYFYNGSAMNGRRDVKNAFIESQIFGIYQHDYFKLANQFLTYNRHYLGLALGYDFMPLLRGEFFSIYDPQGKGLFVSPTLRFNMLDNLDISAGMMMGFTFKKSSSGIAGLLFSNHDTDFSMFKNYLYTVQASFHF